MGFFNWAAPLIRRFGDRFTAENSAEIAEWLSPAVEPGGRVLDVGGGAGQLAVLLAHALSASVTVLDPTPEMIDHVPDISGVSTVTGTAEAMPFADDSFDAIVVSDAFHHFRDQEGAVREFVRVTRPGGLVLILELDPRGLLMGLIVFGEKLLGEPGAFLTPDEMCGFMASQGIDGLCEKLQKADYRFLGTVDKPKDAA
ncbi:MAG: type 11 [Actinobacteria bacterium]|nr:MAG: type 11 [Actinomycetota bacterium]MDO8950094.1 methyltransferase domain-containing protein [Actinomycetota bacterium]